jgi:hypothetical protein
LNPRLKKKSKQSESETSTKKRRQKLSTEWYILARITCHSRDLWNWRVRIIRGLSR